MIFTNKSGLPEYAFNVLKNVFEKHEHVQGDYSMTGIAKSPRQLRLFERHEHEIVIEVSDLMPLLVGIIGHEIFKKFEQKDTLQEEMLETKIMGKLLTGTLDAYHGKSLYDPKFTSSFNVQNQSSLAEWEAQTNGYAFLLRQHGFEVEAIWIIAMIRDWQRRKTFSKDYPQTSIVPVPIGLWTDDSVDEYLHARVSIHETYRDTPDLDLPECTAGERWKKNDSFAVMKEGGKRATKLFDDQPSADEHAMSLGPKFSVQPRIGEWTKCRNYCHAAQFCNQYQNYQAQFYQEQDDE